MSRLVVVVKGVERGNLISQGLTVNSVLLSSVPQLRTPVPSMVLSGLNFGSGVFGLPIGAIFPLIHSPDLKEGVGCGVWGVGKETSFISGGENFFIGTDYWLLTTDTKSCLESIGERVF